jgi:hypothetical protein
MAMEPMQTHPKCILCHQPVEPWPGGGGFGHNPDPLRSVEDSAKDTKGRACNSCQEHHILPVRLRRAGIGV